jgi:hypothetical protein
MEALWAPSLSGRLTCETVWRAQEGCGGSRMILRLDGEVFWDFPEMFFQDPKYPHDPKRTLNKYYGSWHYPVPIDLIETYLNCPIDELFDTQSDAGKSRWKNDENGLLDILRAADRRFGFKRLTWWSLFELESPSLARRILAARFKKSF